MLNHVEIYVSDLSRSRSFWTALLGRIGYDETAAWEDGFTLARDEGAYLTFVQVPRKHAQRPYHRRAVGLNHLAFSVPDRAAVDGLREYCREHEIPCLYDDRYPFATGGDSYYALFIEDPDRIKVEFVAAS